MFRSGSAKVSFPQLSAMQWSKTAQWSNLGVVGRPARVTPCETCQPIVYSSDQNVNTRFPMKHVAVHDLGHVRNSKVKKYKKIFFNLKCIDKISAWQLKTDC